jgi:gamma-glutamyltranspeptidase
VSEILTPAIEYAEHGFPMYEYMHRLLSIPETTSQFALYPPGGTEVFYPGGTPPPVNSLFKQPQLGQTLRLLVTAERAAGGARQTGIRAARAMFYEGDIARRVVPFHNASVACSSRTIWPTIMPVSRRPFPRPLPGMRFIPSRPGPRRPCCYKR